MYAETLEQHQHNDAAKLRKRKLQGHENKDKDICGQLCLCTVADGTPTSQESPQWETRNNRYRLAPVEPLTLRGEVGVTHFRQSCIERPQEY